MTFMQDLTNFMRLALIWTSNNRLIYKTTYRVAEKTGTLCYLRLNLVKYLLRLRNDLYCVEWGVKLYSLTHSLTDAVMFKLISLSESGEHL